MRLLTNNAGGVCSWHTSTGMCSIVEKGIGGRSSVSGVGAVVTGASRFRGHISGHQLGRAFERRNFGSKVCNNSAPQRFAQVSGAQNSRIKYAGKASEAEENRWHAWGVGAVIAVVLGLGLTGSADAAEVAPFSPSLAAACAEQLSGETVNEIIAGACVLEFIALTGAFVGGSLARQRKQEVEKINAQLRQININLRKQARVETYAPYLSYAPVGTALSTAKSSPAAISSVSSAPKEAEGRVNGAISGSKDEILKFLKGGKRYLREQNPVGAFAEFEKALNLATKVGDHIEVKKAARGIGAACQRQGKYREAIKYHEIVLDTSKATKEHAGDVEALGAIADCYTEIGDLENAAKFYDRYIGLLENEGDD